MNTFLAFASVAGKFDPNREIFYEALVIASLFKTCFMIFHLTTEVTIEKI
jgi:hypothetical protein